MNTLTQIDVTHSALTGIDIYRMFVVEFTKASWDAVPNIAKFWLRLYAFVMPKTLFELRIK